MIHASSIKNLGILLVGRVILLVSGPTTLGGAGGATSAAGAMSALEVEFCEDVLVMR